MTTFNIVEATIDELQGALSSGTLTSVDLVARYLRRISVYDCRGVSLNSIPQLNNSVFDEAAASDDRRNAGEPVRPLEGIPYTTKDSYLVKGMTAACGSPAFEHLVGQDDAFTVGTIRAAGGVLLGRTNMPPMAYGGMQRGIYGRAESPYNSKFLAAAYWSGSSNGSAVATAASFAAFGMGEETVSSGRSPASNNGLVAYTPSRGWISIRGNWPLYPTCDVVVPHTRTMHDMLTLLDIITADDPVTEGDFWRNQPFVKLEKPWAKGPRSFHEIDEMISLSGLRIAVPSMYIGGSAPTGAIPVTTCPEVVELWEQARRDLESLGAEVVVVPDFPVVTAYENPDLLPKDCSKLPNNWTASEKGPLIAHGWNDFMQQNRDPRFPNLTSVDPLNIYPESLRTPAELKVIDKSNAIHWNQLAGHLRQPLHDVENLGIALSTLEAMRKCLLEDWLSSLECDCVVFPAAGDVADADADVNEDSAVYAKRNGVYYSNGNKALRHLGVPSVSVPMGVMREKRMPMSLTFAGRSYDDANLLRYGNAYERKTRKRKAPPLTPEIRSDTISHHQLDGEERATRPDLTVEKCEILSDGAEGSSEIRICIEGTVTITNVSGQDPFTPQLEISIDSAIVPAEEIDVKRQGQSSNGKEVFHFSVTRVTPRPIVRDQRSQTYSPVARDKTMVVILARSRVGGQPSGWLGLV
ncbi:amidase signature enzyme [Melanomma pulvis-pyrius CBS 109.77]|uniref:Amidase signature enzyme n=1 Tax=Melanomma pulvis-pyrius CBS 109.77 TaxID=1314802 RepID=A0A6A6XT04_9PLEO|nr:amidase signature enzyme [Melanomma pulvis-pyrius CBS 109.77]